MKEMKNIGKEVKELEEEQKKDPEKVKMKKKMNENFVNKFLDTKSEPLMKNAESPPPPSLPNTKPLKRKHNVPILTEQEKVDMNHPKKEIYISPSSVMKVVSKKEEAILRNAVGNDRKDLPLSTIDLEAAVKTKIVVVQTTGSGAEDILLTNAATGNNLRVESLFSSTIEIDFIDY
jgi:hypothetical protein